MDVDAQSSELDRLRSPSGASGHLRERRSSATSHPIGMVRAKPALGIGAQLGIGDGRQLELAPYGGRIWRLSQQRIHQRAGRAALGSKHLFGERRDSDIASHDRLTAQSQECYSACNFDPLSWGIGVQN